MGEDDPLRRDVIKVDQRKPSEAQGSIRHHDVVIRSVKIDTNNDLHHDSQDAL